MSPWGQSDRRRAGPPNAPCLAIRSAWPTFRSRAVGALLLLRDAHHPRLLPLLLGHRRRSRAAEDHGDWDRRRVRRAGVPVHRARWLSAARHGTHGVLRRRSGHVRSHRTGDRAGFGGCRRRADSCRARLRCVEGQRVVIAGNPVREGRCPLRRWLHPVLSRHQPRSLHRPTAHRPVADSRRIPLRLRCRGSRHGTGSCPVRPRSGETWARTAALCQANCHTALLDGLPGWLWSSSPSSWWPL